jgi:hypothetical protein
MSSSLVSLLLSHSLPACRFNGEAKRMFSQQALAKGVLWISFAASFAVIAFVAIAI